MAKTYRVAVIGSTGRGNYGHGLDTCWLDHDRTEIVGVADDNKQGLASAAERLKVDKTFVDYRELLDKTKPDIVAIAPRWVDQHHAMSLAAAERGIHIYMEKPLCPTLAEADEIAAACERTHSLLALALPTHYSPKLATVKKLIDEGAIGQVLEYRARGKEDRRGGGEDLWVLGTHLLDMIRVLGGNPMACYAQVLVEGHPITKKDVIQGAEGLGPLAGDHVSAMYTMPHQAMAYFQSVRNMAGKPSRYALQVLGSRGMFELLEGTMPAVKYLGDPGWSPGRSGAEWQDVSSAGIGQPEPITDPQADHRHLLAIDDLLDAIENSRQPKCSIYDGIGATEMIMAVFESQRLREPVTLPLKNRRHPLSML